MWHTYCKYCSVFDPPFQYLLARSPEMCYKLDRPSQLFMKGYPFHLLEMACGLHLGEPLSMAGVSRAPYDKIIFGPNP